MSDSDLPKGYRWAREDEMDRHDAIVVPRSVDSQGIPYTQDEADLAVPYSTNGRPNKNYILQLMRDGDMGDPWGTAMAWAFACAETLTVLGVEIPALDYQPSPYVRVEAPENYYPESYEDMAVWEFLDAISEVWDLDQLARISEVQQACKILDRYLDWCKLAGRDY